MADFTTARICSIGGTRPSPPFVIIQVAKLCGDIPFSRDCHLAMNQGLRNPSLLHRRPNSCKANLHDRRLPYNPFADALEAVERGNQHQSLFDRVALAWQILFPKKKKVASNAEIAKQRLKMIFISDRCSVNNEAKRKIVSNIVGVLSDFVEIESEDSVRLNVSADPDLGTVYSVTVPVRRVRPEFQDFSEELNATEFRNEVQESLSADERFGDEAHKLFTSNSTRRRREEAQEFSDAEDEFSESQDVEA